MIHVTFMELNLLILLLDRAKRQTNFVQMFDDRHTKIKELG